MFKKCDSDFDTVVHLIELAAAEKLNDVIELSDTISNKNIAFFFHQLTKWKLFLKKPEGGKKNLYDLLDKIEKQQNAAEINPSFLPINFLKYHVVRDAYVEDVSSD